LERAHSPRPLSRACSSPPRRRHRCLRRPPRPYHHRPRRPPRRCHRRFCRSSSESTSTRSNLVEIHRDSNLRWRSSSESTWARGVKQGDGLREGGAATTAPSSASAPTTPVLGSVTPSAGAHRGPRQRHHHRARRTLRCGSGTPCLPKWRSRGHAPSCTPSYGHVTALCLPHHRTLPLHMNVTTAIIRSHHLLAHISPHLPTSPHIFISRPHLRPHLAHISPTSRPHEGRPHLAHISPHAPVALPAGTPSSRCTAAPTCQRSSRSPSPCRATTASTSTSTTSAVWSSSSLMAR